MHLNTRDAAFKTTADVSDTREFGLLGINALGCTSKESLVHLLVTGDYDLVQNLTFGLEDDLHASASGNDSIFITHIGDLNLCACWHIQREMTIKIGSDAVLGIALLNDRSTDYGLVVLIKHRTANLCRNTKRGECHD